MPARPGASPRQRWSAPNPHRGRRRARRRQAEPHRQHHHPSAGEVRAHHPGVVRGGGTLAGREPRVASADRAHHASGRRAKVEQVSASLRGPRLATRTRPPYGRGSRRRAPGWERVEHAAAAAMFETGAHGLETFTKELRPADGQVGAVFVIRVPSSASTHSTAPHVGARHAGPGAELRSRCARRGRRRKRVREGRAGSASCGRLERRRWKCSRPSGLARTFASAGTPSWAGRSSLRIAWCTSSRSRGATPGDRTRAATGAGCSREECEGRLVGEAEPP